MKKKFSGTTQISLFDIFDSNNNADEISHGNIQPQRISGQSAVYDEDKPGAEAKGGTEQLQGHAIVRHDEGTATGAFSENDNRQLNSNLSEQGNSTLFQNDASTHQQWNERIRSQRTGMAGTSEKGRAGLTNYHNTQGFDFGKSFSKTNAFHANRDALETLFKLEHEQRIPTEEEKHLLARFVGFGGLKEILLDPDNENEWKTQSDSKLRDSVKEIYKLLSLLDKDGTKGLLQSAKRSILNAHFTAFPVINAIYHAIEKAGFQYGNILEPAAGVGNFLAGMPERMAEESNVTAIEMDQLTGRILQKLYPTAETRITGFEKINLPENNFDLIISNVPFGDVPVFDTQLANHKDKAYQGACDNIHNYFFAKSLLLAKPGGLIVFITSRYTLDSSQNKNIRELLNDKASFLGAIRLPNTAFKANAGTEVVSDIIFLKKFGLGESIKQQHQFQSVKSEPFSDHNGVSGMLTYNEYFHHNPTHLLGTKEFGGLYRKDEFNLKGDSGKDLGKVIETIAGEIFREPVIKPNLVAKQSTDPSGASIKPGQFDSIGNLVALNDGSFGMISPDIYIDAALDERAQTIGINPSNIRNNNLSIYEEEKLQQAGLRVEDYQLKVITPVKINKADLHKARDFISLRKLTKELLYKEMNNFNDYSLEQLRGNLYRAYNSFRVRHGNLLHKNNERLLSQDADGFVVQALEKKDKITGKISASDILFKRTINPVKEVISVDNVQDAVTLSLQKYGKLQMNYICELLDQSFEDLMKTQKGDETLIFQDDNHSFQTRDEYLSGNVVEKLEQAKLKAESDPAYINNVEQLTRVQPKPVPMVDIYSPLHTRWIPKEHVNTFLSHLLKTDRFALTFSKSLDAYSLSIEDNTAQAESFRSARRSPAWIISHALNGIEPIVQYTVKDEEGREKTVFDAQDTSYAKELYRNVRNAWDEFKLLDPERRRHLESIYNQLFNTTVLRDYKGSHLLFPGLSNFILRKHQADCVFRNVQQLGGINDHKVGAGKTLIEIATAMELRRLAICNKPMIIGLKSQVPQLYETFKKAYPLSKVLFPSEKDFSRENRQRLLNNIATNEWDCIILSHDQFNMIRQPVQMQEAIINELKKEIEEEIWSTDDKAAKKKLETQLYSYEQKLAQLGNLKKDDKVFDFSQLGVDFLMVDESQEYKNLEFITRKRNIKGLGNPLGSKRAFNLLIACRYLQELHGGDKGILFSSGTPLSNTMAELYLLFKYLTPSKLQKMGLTSFDRWAANFANDYSELEYYMGRFKEVHRFREFTNLPELISMYRSIADVRNDHNLKIDKPKAVHNLIKIAPSETQLSHIEMLQQYINTKGNDYAEELGLTAGYDERKNVNPSYGILAINYAKKLSLDPRLINKTLEAGTKLEAVAKNIVEIYHDTNGFKGTQLVFCDLGTPKSRNQVDNLFDHLQGDIPDADLNEIFGENYYDLTRKPSLESIKDKISDMLKLSGEEVNSLVLEANTAENFNVYDELKRLMVLGGIKENEIAFIHDYNTRKQKEYLYELVNNGTVRVVIGSTKKLGTGVNVQERCVAGHNVDMPWRPSDLEQRLGRFERQGNEAAKKYCGNLVTANYYATERTLDASLYNTVGLKSHFIAQVKLSADPNIRIAKDIEEDIDMSQMAAELSGDPIFKEKASLSKKITELEQLNKSWLHKRTDTEDNLKRATRLKDHYENKIDVLTRTIPQLDNIPKEKEELKIVASVKGESYDKIGAFGAAMLKEALYIPKYKQHGYAFELGSLWDFKVMGTIEQNWSGRHVVRQVLSPMGEKIGTENILPEGEMAAGLQIKNIILEMPKELSASQRKLDDTNANITEYENQLKQDNPYRTDLLYSQKRLAEVDRIIVKRTEDEKKIKTDDNPPKLGIAV